MGTNNFLDTACVYQITCILAIVGFRPKPNQKSLVLQFQYENSIITLT